MGRGEHEEYPHCVDGAIEVAASAPSVGSEEKMQRKEGGGWGLKEETARGIFKDIAAQLDVMMALRSAPSIECAMVRGCGIGHKRGLSDQRVTGHCEGFRDCQDQAHGYSKR